MGPERATAYRGPKLTLTNLARELKDASLDTIFQFKISSNHLKPLLNEGDVVLVHPTIDTAQSFIPGQLIFAKKTFDRTRGGQKGNFYIIHALITRASDKHFSPKNTNDAPVTLLIGDHSRATGRCHAPLGLVTHVISADGYKETTASRVSTVRWRVGNTEEYLNKVR